MGMKFSPTQMREAWFFFFLLGLVMLNYPFLLIFNKPVCFLGIPLPVLYVFIGWPLSILVVFIFSRCLIIEEEQNEATQDSDSESP